MLKGTIMMGDGPTAGIFVSVSLLTGKLDKQEEEMDVLT